MSRWQRTLSIAATVVGLGACSSDPMGVAPDSVQRPTEPARASASLPVQSSVILTIGDTYVRQGHPNQSFGAENTLRLQASGRNKAFIKFADSEVRAVANGSIVSAHLELEIVENADNWGPNGRPVDVHLVQQDWEETSATWNCADDADLTNSRPDCPSASWSLAGNGPRPWDETAAASATITNGLTGVLRFDVTASVQAALSESTGELSWVVKKRDEGQEGRVEFASRESGGVAPRLVLVVENDSGFIETFDDGEFTSNPAWFFRYLPSVGTATVGASTGALQVRRSGAGGSGQAIALETALDLAVGNQTAISFDVKVVSSSVPGGCGFICTEYPAMVTLLLELEDGSGLDLWLAYNNDGGYSQVYPGGIGLAGGPIWIVANGAAPTNEWLRDERFVIRDLVPTARRITAIQLYGAGWDFEGWYDNVRISDH